MIRFFKPKPKKTLKCIAKGYVPWGIGCVCHYYNLYEDENGHRSYDEFVGEEKPTQLDTYDFTTKARVVGWIHGGSLPQTLIYKRSHKCLK